MKLGLHIPDFTWPGGTSALRTDLVRIAKDAEDAGFDRLSVMDHVWQIDMMGPRENDMLEAYTTLGFLAAVTERIQLMTLVTGVVYRSPGLLAKMISTLDVLSGGRAWLGIGAAWYEDEANGLGLFFPPQAERFERLEETLQVALAMWESGDAPFHGKHYQLERTLNVPAPLRKPRPPILIGGSGEKKTLRLVARYATACNIFNDDQLPRKLDVLSAHCEREGRNYDEIEKTVVYRFDLGADGEHIDATLADFERLSALGITVVHGSAQRIAEKKTLELFANQLIPKAASI
jgi:alkanesulfonate monooxygenase